MQTAPIKSNYYDKPLKGDPGMPGPPGIKNKKKFWLI